MALPNGLSQRTVTGRFLRFQLGRVLRLDRSRRQRTGGIHHTTHDRHPVASALNGVETSQRELASISNGRKTYGKVCSNDGMQTHCTLSTVSKSNDSMQAHCFKCRQKYILNPAATAALSVLYATVSYKFSFMAFLATQDDQMNANLHPRVLKS